MGENAAAFPFRETAGATLAIRTGTVRGFESASLFWPAFGTRYALCKRKSVFYDDIADEIDEHLLVAAWFWHVDHYREGGQKGRRHPQSRSVHTMDVARRYSLRVFVA